MMRMITDNGLKHTGVIGMRWGAHRAKKSGKTYEYKSRRTAVLEKGANIFGIQTNLRKGTPKQIERSKHLDKIKQDITLKTHMGYEILKNLMGKSNIASHQITQIHKEMGFTRGQQIVSRLFLGSNKLGVSVAERNYLRKGPKQT